MKSIAANLSVVKQRRLLSDVSLCCEPGECIAVIGENGAGKSLLLRSLALIEDGAHGFVEFFGKRFDLSGEPASEGPWPDLSIVLQSLALWPHLSAHENLLLPWRSRDIEKRLGDADLENLIDQFDLRQLLGQVPSSLSGGQRQRVALARTLALQPKVLLLDEPTSALDARQTENVLTALSLAKTQGMSLVVVSHSLGFAGKIADRFLFLNEGQAQAEGAWDELDGHSNVSLQKYLEFNAGGL